MLRPADLLRPEEASGLDLATQGYGVGCWYLLAGERLRAIAIFERVAANRLWPAFAVIAAEVELAELSR
ncbi:MAG: hypothetical protein HY716_17695 [Planctomycetes bacterium]|nr:hypothetical protein [Planctomycetota bacterium]